MTRKQIGYLYEKDKEKGIQPPMPGPKPMKTPSLKPQDPWTKIKNYLRVG